MGIELDAEFDIKAAFDTTNGKIAKLEKLQRSAYKAVAPVFYRATQNGNFPAAGSLILRLGGPDQGHFWYVRTITVGGLSPITAAPGRADIFVSASDLRIFSTSAAPLGQIGLADWRDQATAMPLMGSYGEGELPLRLNEELFVIISNGSVGQTYVASAGIVDYEEAASRQDWAK